jgi:hypothetical protein
VSRNGKQSPARPRLELAGGTATPEEAAAITAAIEQFLQDTPPAPAPAGSRIGGWQRAGLFEGAGLAADAPSPWIEPWGDPEPWGR